MPIDTLPVRARPEALLRICTNTKNESISLEELSVRIPLEREDIEENVKYGSSLGFVNFDEQIELTERGLRLAYEDGISDDVGSLFIQGLRNYEEYRSLTETLAEKLGDISEIDQKEVIQVLRVDFGVNTEETELKSAINSYFLTLEAAGAGEYKLTRGGSPSRFVLREGITLGNIVSDDSDILDRAEEAERLVGTGFPAFSEYDSELEARCLPQFRLGLYQEAVTSATTVLEDRIRNEGGFDEGDHGQSLMAQAFDEDDGPLQLGVVDTEKQGFRFIYQGTSMAIRNPPHHRLLDDMDQAQARDILGFINLLLTFIENRN
ncbi:TIGR02391 family protein [Halorubrum ezzemoulense]|uniref:TIGR02391 family protein n=1 Tax=Halorubrum ezzemoulense TaxID=337243 RepID=A0A256JCB8_HALEZ|nr:TIGR02391 family protein [Halorubrum ezzemoulense]OYR66494.1 TIGR02391 family protein [Halorubrum ezzemoulense]